MADTFTDRDLRDEITRSLDADMVGAAEGFDVDGIVEEIQRDYGTVSIETIEHDDYWDIVERHAR